MTPYDHWPVEDAGDANRDEVSNLDGLLSGGNVVAIKAMAF